MISGLKRHALVVLVAVLMATYQLYRLETQRARRSADVNEEFERATRFLQNQLSAHSFGGAGRYEVRVTVAPHAPQHKSALVINRQFDVPRIEAELLVDPRLVAARKQHTSNSVKAKARSGAGTTSSTRPPPVLRLRIYDHATMHAVAQMLQQKRLVAATDTT